MKLFKTIHKRPVIAAIIALASVSIIAAVILIKFFPPGSAGKFNADSVEAFKTYDITPLSSDSSGVNPDSSFKIACPVNSTEPEVKALLKVNPAQNFDLKKLSDNEMLMSFNNKLSSNSIYTFSLVDKSNTVRRSWAFQTKKQFRIMRTLPRHKATSVPVNSGIEIAFSHANVEALDKYFKISPLVNGRFEYHGKTAVFVPEKLNPDTIYTVTIEKGLGIKDSSERLAESLSFSFQTADPSTPQTYSNYFSFADNYINETPSKAPVIEIFANETLKNAEINVQVYRYPDSKAFVDNLKKYEAYPGWAYINREKISFDTSTLEPAASFNTKLVNTESNYWQSSLLYFPEALTEGYYLITAKAGDVVTQTHLQVNRLAVYISADKGQTLVWVNDTASGQPAPAEVKTPGLEAARTDEEGVALIKGSLPDPSEARYTFFTVTSGQGPDFIAMTDTIQPYGYGSNYSDYNNEDIRNTFWTYIYLDRGIYMPTDTVRIWGLVKPRNGTKPPSEFDVQLCQFNYSYDGNGDIAVVASKEVSSTAAGNFKADMAFSNLTPGSYQIRIISEGRILMECYFEIRQYTKPAYKIDITPSRERLFAWEKLDLDIQASFYEGSPVSGLNLTSNYYLNGSGHEGTLKCDSNGSASMQITPLVDTESWHPENLFINISNAQAEEEEVISSSSILVFPKDTMIEIDSKLNGGKAQITVKTSLIDPSGDWDNSYLSFEDSFRGKAVSRKLEARILEKHWDKRVVGDYYDPINKTTSKKYEYFEVSTLVKNLNFTTVNGLYEFDFDVRNGKNYVVEVAGSDSRGSTIFENAYVNVFDYNAGYKQNDVMLVRNEKDNAYKPGDSVSFNLMYKGNDIRSGRVLYMTFRNGLQGSSVSYDGSYRFNFTQQYIPNLFVQAVYFDGTGIYNAGIQEVRYDVKNSLLQVSVKPDREDYKPGDTVNLEIETSDAKGSPCPAEVNISVVDESLFTLQNQYVNTLDSLYHYSLSSGIVASFISQTPIEIRFFGGAEQGGEGGDNSPIRSTFKDTAFFSTVATDDSGKAKISFKLPDNLTSWRVTYQGISADLKAGSGRLNVDVKLPFFVNTVFNDLFMSGDSPSIALRAYGTVLKGSEEIKYQVTLRNMSGESKTFTASGKAGNFTNIALGSLKKGAYTLTSNASYANYSDTLKRDFQVVDDVLQASRTKYYKLTSNTRLDTPDSLATLYIYNSRASKYFEVLNKLNSAWGERVDQKLSRALASELLRKHFGQDTDINTDIDLRSYQLNDGGIALLSYDSSNPELSAKISSLAPDYFDITALKGYFYHIIDNQQSQPTDVAAAFWGLAALREPVLIDIQHLAASEALSIREQLYLAIALAEFGDFKGADILYKNVFDDYGKKLSDYYFIDDGISNRDNIVDITALFSIIAFKLDTPEKDGLFGYVSENSTNELLTNLEQLTFIANTSPELAKADKFTYELDGKTKTVSLDKAKKFRLVLPQDRLSRIKFSDISGDMTIAVTSTGPVKDLLKQANTAVTIDRSYSVAGKEPDEFAQSDVVKITLRPRFDNIAPDGYYIITDVLPSGFRYVPGKPDYERKWYPHEVSGQRVSFGFYYNKQDTKKIDEIAYYARAVFPGEYTADNAVIKHFRSDISGFTSREHIQIK